MVSAVSRLGREGRPARAEIEQARLTSMPAELIRPQRASRTSANRGPWWWVPSLYFAEGVPYVVVMTVAVIMFKRLGVGNTQIALYTSWLYLPYAIKPLWSPLVQRIGTRRGWVVVMQLLIAAGLACTALAIPLDSFLRWSLVALAAVAISSATHDVAADGFYLLALSSHQQAWFVGIRSTAYRMAMIAGQGLLVMLAGALESATGLPVVDVQVQRGRSRASRNSIRARRSFSVVDGSEAQRMLSAQPDVMKSVFAASRLRRRKIAEGQRCANGMSGTGSMRPPEESRPRRRNRAGCCSLEEFIRRRFGPTKPMRRPNERPRRRCGDRVDAAWPSRCRRASSRSCNSAGSAGDKDFDVVEGERFVVTEANWNEPFAAVVQVDAEARSPVGGDV